MNEKLRSMMMMIMERKNCSCLIAIISCFIIYVQNLRIIRSQAINKTYLHINNEILNLLKLKRLLTVKRTF